MEKYDVVIVGAGIAGCGLAYNLKRADYKGSVLIIDKKEIGANAAYGYRNTFKEIIDEYNLPYKHKFKGVKIGTLDKTYFTLNEKFYFVDYKKICKYLLKKSDIEFKKEKALTVKNKILFTNKERYEFNFLIDCSGHNFFVRNLYNLPLPFRYWIGKVRTLKNKINLGNYYYYLFNEKGYMEDIYSFKNKTLQGDWQYVSKIDFSLIRIPKDSLHKKLIKNPSVIKEYKVVIPTTPVLPLVYKNYTFVGDSFGNATTSSSEGVGPILDSSHILAEAIENNDLRSYEKKWKEKYLLSYLKKLTLKLNDKLKVKLFKILKENPILFKQILENNNNPQIQTELKKIIPVNMKINLMKNYLLLKFKYLKMNYSITNLHTQF